MNKILPSDYLEKYIQLLDLLLGIQEVTIAPTTPTITIIPATTITQNCQELQDFYQESIFPLTGAEVPLEIVSRWRSLQTEIHRSMKLLAMDLSLLKASRSPEKQAQRQQGLSDRLTTLISYCRVILT